MDTAKAGGCKLTSGKAVIHRLTMTRLSAASSNSNRAGCGNKTPAEVFPEQPGGPVKSQARHSPDCGLDLGPGGKRLGEAKHRDSTGEASLPRGWEDSQCERRLAARWSRAGSLSPQCARDRDCREGDHDDARSRRLWPFDGRFIGPIYSRTGRARA